MEIKEELLKRLIDDTISNYANGIGCYHKEDLIVDKHDGKVKFGDYLVLVNAYMIWGSSFCLSDYIGRVVQIREEAGHGFSDAFFLRNLDGGLSPIGNGRFIIVQEPQLTTLENLYQERGLIERDGKEGEMVYMAENYKPMKGFIIKAK